MANGVEGREASDARVLHELRRRSILQLAPAGMSREQANNWADKGSIESMQQRLREVDAWVAEERGEVLGWVAVRNDRVDGLYVEPIYARRGIGRALLQVVEDEVRRRGIEVLWLDASWNAEGFYLRQGYEAMGPRPPDDARPMRKRLSPKRVDD